MSSPRYESEIMNCISDRLTNLMIENQINANELANKLHCSISTVKRIKLGYTSTNLMTLIQICDVFGCSLNWLTGVSDE